MHENWKKPADLDAHAQSAHLKRFAQIANQWLERPAKITKWPIVSEVAP